MEDIATWRLPECWTLAHAGGGVVRIDSTQDGNTIVGTAHRDGGGDAPDAAGIVSGWLVEDDITLTIYWPDGPVAEYQGTVDADGAASGTVAEKAGQAGARWDGQSPLLRWARGSA